MDGSNQRISNYSTIEVTGGYVLRCVCVCACVHTYVHIHVAACTKNLHKHYENSLLRCTHEDEENNRKVLWLTYYTL